jgi:hypothetical protein
MSIKEYEAANLLLPLKNTDAMKAVANVLAESTSRTIDLSTYFSQLGAGHFLTLVADGAKIYVSMGHAAGTIDETVVGTHNNSCVPVPDGSSLHGIPIAGRTVATGIATMLNFNVLHYKTSASGVTGYLRMYRSSLAPSQDAGHFKAP